MVSGECETILNRRANTFLAPPRIFEHAAAAESESRERMKATV